MLSRFTKILSFPLIVFFIFYFFIYPVFIEAVENRQVLTEEESKLESIEEKINSMEIVFMSSIEYLNSTEGISDYSFINLAIPSHPNVHDIILELKNKSSQGVDFFNIESILIDDEPQYEDIYSVNFSFSISGEYEQVNSFILELQKLDRVFILKNIEFSEDASTQVVNSEEGVVQHDNIIANIDGFFLYSINKDIIYGGLSFDSASSKNNYYPLENPEDENEVPKIKDVTTTVGISWELIQDPSIEEYEVQYCRGTSCEFSNPEIVKVNSDIFQTNLEIVRRNGYAIVFVDPPGSDVENFYKARVRVKRVGFEYGPWTPILEIYTEL